MIVFGADVLTHVCVNWNLFIKASEKKEWTTKLLIQRLSGCTFDLFMHKANINHVNEIVYLLCQ
jgi:hypothetical protein